MVSGHASTLHADESDSHSSVFSFSITTPTIGYSDNAEWILDTWGTYHVCPNRDWFSTFEKLDGCFTVMGIDHPCNVEGIATVNVKIFNGVVWEFKEVRYAPQLKMNLILVGTLETLCLMVSIWDGVLKMTKGSMVVMKGIRRNNLYYLKGGTVTG